MSAPLHFANTLLLSSGMELVPFFFLIYASVSQEKVTMTCGQWAALVVYSCLALTLIDGGFFFSPTDHVHAMRILSSLCDILKIPPLNLIKKCK